ncbi:MAG TPA: ATP-binding protein [Coleofasciculaceae cyanobacterium]
MVDNITEHMQQAEAALQQSEACFRVVAETAACAIMVCQGDYLRYVNQATETITGYRRDELLSMTFWQLAHPDYQDLVKQRGLARQQGEAVSPRYEVKILTKTGEERWVDLTAGSILFEDQPAALATAYDITDRKQAEVRLQQAAGREQLLSQMAQRIRRSLDLTEILNTTVAEVRQFLQADRVFITQLEQDACHTVAESVTPTWNSMMDWVPGRSAVSALQQLFTSNKTGHCCIQVVNNTHEVELTPFLAEYYQRTQLQAGISAPIVVDGNLFGVLLINQCSHPRQWQPFEVDFLQQLTTQVEIAIQQGQLYQKLQRLATSLEEQVENRTIELKHRMQELQNLNQVKDLLLHAVSHDLKTPVQGMLMLLDRLLNKFCPSEPTIAMTRSTAEQLLQTTRQQLTLLNCLIEQQQDIAPQPVTNWKPVQITAQVQILLTEIQPLLQQNQVHLVNHLNDQIPKVKADPYQLRQVLQQLLQNAIKHNLPKITITLSATVECSGNLPMICCTIADNGIGIRPEQCDRLFQLYIRSIDNPHLTGIGLGLHQCRQIIRAHGGQIGVTSKPGDGASFWFTLPMIDEDREGRSLQSTAPQ